MSDAPESNGKDNDQGTTEDGTKRQAPSTAFTSESAREAGKKSAATRKAGPSDDAAIIRKLRSKAARGDVAAARELREWQHLDADASTGDDWLGLLTKGERTLVRGVMRHVRGRRLGQVEGEHPLVAQAAEAGEGAGFEAGDGDPHDANAKPSG